MLPIFRDLDLAKGAARLDNRYWFESYRVLAVAISSVGMQDGTEKSLGGVVLLSEIPLAVLHEIEDMAIWAEVPSDEIVVDRNDTNTDIYFIVRGRVQVIDFLEGRSEVVLAELGEGEYFGDLSAIDLNKRSARVTTVEPTVLASLTAHQFHGVLLRCPEVAVNLLRKFACLVRLMTVKVTALSSLSPQQRVFLELLRISEPNSMGDGTWIIQKFPNHTQIASTVGTDKGIVAIAIGELAREKVVERKHRSLIIHDYPRLQMLASM